MFKNNAFKKFSVVLASLALILPLASVGNYSVSANNKVSKKQMVRVIHKARNNKKSKMIKHARKAHPKMNKRGNVKAHHYYKFAYNKREYEKYVKFARTYRKGFEKQAAKYNVNRKSVSYRKGFKDALYNGYHHSLVNNKQYAKGYILGDAISVNGNASKKSLKQASSWYKSFKKMGPGTGTAVEQWKNEAHIDTL